jgi:hypothetical protein
MRKNAFHEFNAKTLSKHLKINVKKVTVYLNRLHNKGFILRTAPGFYKAVADMTVVRQNQMTNPPTLLHGLLLECSLIRKVTKDPQGGFPKRKIVILKMTKELIRWLDANEFVYREDNHSYFRYVWWENRRITVTVFETCKLHVYISSSKCPLSFPEFENLLVFLDGFLDAIAPFDEPRLIKLKEVGVAKDFKELRLDGVSSVSLRAFRNAFARIYYKDDIQATRIEHHLMLDMPLDDALKSLSILTHPVNYAKMLQEENKPDEKRDVT